jgi:cytochrome P450
VFRLFRARVYGGLKVMQEQLLQAPDQVSNLPLPPQAKGLPLFGSALEMASQPLQFWVDNYLALGPVYQVTAFNRQFFVMAGPEANLFMTRMNDGYVSSHGTWADYAKEANAPHQLTMLDGEAHIRQRKVMRPTMARSAIINRFSEVVQITDNEINALTPGTSISVLAFFQKLICNQLGLMLAGRIAGDRMQDIITVVRTRLNTLVVRNRPKLLLSMPAYQRASLRVQQFAQEIIAERRARPRPEIPDFVDDMIAGLDNELNDFTESDLEASVLSPFIAGLDTVANTCTFMLYALLRYPEVLTRVKEEVDRLFAAGLPTSDGLEQMTALHGTAMETLRIYPVAGVLPRTAVKDFEFAGYRIPQGVELLVAAMVSHFLPTFYPNPEKFDIERYHAPYNQHRQPGAFAPFGLGAHACLGAGLAEVQIMLTLAQMINRVEFELDPPDFQPKIENNPTLTPGYRFRVRVKALRA